MAGVYSRNPFTLPQQGEDPFAPTYFQPSEGKEVPFGSSAGGEAVLNAYAFGNPGYSQSNYDRYAQDIAAKNGYGNELMGYEDGLQLTKEQTNQYYDSIRRMNDISVKAEQLGFNIKKPNPMDEVQVALYQEYQDTFRNAKYTANVLKQGRENEKAYTDQVLKGQVIANNFNPAFTGQTATSAQDLAGIKQMTSANVDAYNDAQRNFDNQNAYGQGKQYESGLRAHYQSIVDNPNSDPYARQVAASQLGQMDVTTYDNDQALNRAQQAQLARERQANSASQKVGAQAIIQTLNGLRNGQGFENKGGRFVNTALQGVPIFGKTVQDAERGSNGQVLLRFTDGSQSALDDRSFFTVAQGLAQKNGLKPEDVILHARESQLVGNNGEFLAENLNTPEVLKQTQEYNQAMDEVNAFKDNYVTTFAEKSIPGAANGDEKGSRTRNFLSKNGETAVALYPGTTPTSKITVVQEGTDQSGNLYYKVLNDKGEVQQYIDQSGQVQPAERLYRDQVLNNIAKPIAEKLIKSQPAYKRAREINARIQNPNSGAADVDFQRTNNTRSSSSTTSASKNAPAKSVSRATLQGLVGKPGYEGYSVDELAAYYKSNGYTIQ